LLESIISHFGLRRAFVPVPFVIWQLLAWVAELSPRPPVTRNQVELMKIDNVSSSVWPGFTALGIEPRRIETVLEAK
jgi:NADH dehydrogenase